MKYTIYNNTIYNTKMGLIKIFSGEEVLAISLQEKIRG
jgi:hypothetical protein